MKAILVAICAISVQSRAAKFQNLKQPVTHNE
jgi:hypothetical protein